MREAFFSTLTRLAMNDRRIFLLTGDIGYGVLEDYARSVPDRFVNVGVAEQNMIGVATGLAEAGYIPFVYSMVPFACLRPYEFIRNGPLLHRLPVRIVGIGGGMDYAHDGVSHYGLEDIALMRAQPSMHVIVPADGEQASRAMEKTFHLQSPVYFRLEKCDRGHIEGLDGQFSLGLSEVLSDGKDLLVIACGSIVFEAQEAVRALAEHGVSCRLLAVSTLNPCPADDLRKHLSEFNKVMTVESHYQSGGLGSLIAELIADSGLSCKLVRNAVNEMPNQVSGSRNFMEKRFELDSLSLSRKAMALLRSGS